MSEELFDVKNILQELGYSPKEDGAQFYRMNAVYRAGDNSSAIRISKNNGYWTDFVEGKGGSLKDLINLTLGFTKVEELNTWIENKKIELPAYQEKVPKIELQKKFDVEIINNLVKDNSYWESRGISAANLQKFGGGVCLTDHLKDRYVFPIWNNKKELIGLAGRDITGKKKIKWKLMGEKKEWVWPAIVNLPEIRKKKEIILVESIGETLALSECGINNSLALFGVNISWKIINFCLTIKPEKIIVATNNDTDFGGSDTGNEASLKIYKSLTKWMDCEVVIKLPKLANDFGEILEKFGKQEIIETFNVK